MIGVSDVHDLIDWDYMPHLVVIDLLLVLADSASNAMKALFAGHTVVYYKDWLMGMKDQREAHAGADRSEGRSLRNRLTWFN